jgi:hypothetical protein
MRIKIYDKSFSLLTILFVSSSTSDFNNLTYVNQLKGVGSASFVVRTDNSKISQTTIKEYNKVEITDDDGTVRWVGVIVGIESNLNIMSIKCYGLAHILDRRLTSAALNYYTGNANTQIIKMLNETNAAENTGIIAGTINIATSINPSLIKSKIWQAIQSISNDVDAQYLVGNDRKLYFQTLVGRDLSGSVFFRFEKLNPAQANILSFKVNEDGTTIISSTYGNGKTINSASTDAAIVAEFGLLEDHQNFTDAADQTNLDRMTANNNFGSQISPTIELSPTVDDNFEVGDIVSIKLNNGFIAIDTQYQVIEKTVRIINGQKMITIKPNVRTRTFIDEVKKMKTDIELLKRAI